MREALERLYTDTMRVWRYGSDAQGERTEAEAVLSGIPCRLSFSGRYAQNGAAAREGGRLSAPARPLLICAPEWGLRAGDFVSVTRRNGESYSGNIGRPRLYSSSQQVYFAAQELC